MPTTEPTRATLNSTPNETTNASTHTPRLFTRPEATNIPTTIVITPPAEEPNANDDALSKKVRQNALLEASQTSARARSVSPARRVRVQGDPLEALEIDTSRSLFNNIVSPRTSPSVPRNQAAASTLSLFNPIAENVSKYAELSNLLIQSTMKSQSKTIKYGNIMPSDMISMEVDQIDDNKEYEVGFTRKYCIATINHASLAFRDPETEKFLVIGRQNNEFLKSNPNSDHTPNFWVWAASKAFNPAKLMGAIWHFTETHMDNEKKFDFFPGSPFDAEITDVILTGAEIKAILKAVDNDVCAQRYDLVRSNCYSSVLYGLTQAIKLIDEKDDGEEETHKASNKAIKRLFTLICSALQDNHKLGLGGLDNPVVNEAIMDIIDILEKRELLNINHALIANACSPHKEGEDTDDCACTVRPR